jgi:hypothetical protein
VIGQMVGVGVCLALGVLNKFKSKRERVVSIGYKRKYEFQLSSLSCNHVVKQMRERVVSIGYKKSRSLSYNHGIKQMREMSVIMY